MRTVILASLMVMLAGAVRAQPQGLNAAPVPGQESTRPSPRSGMPSLRGDLQAPAASIPSRQRPPRPENAVGPDLMAYVFAPIGGIVEPITDGLHAFDAAIAPINEALQPITGPYGADLIVPPGEAAAPVPEGAVAAPPPGAPPVVGPRK